MTKKELELRLCLSEIENERLSKENDIMRRKLRADKYDTIKIEMRDFMTGAFFETEQILIKFRKTVGIDLFDRVISGISTSRTNV